MYFEFFKIESGDHKRGKNNNRKGGEEKKKRRNRETIFVFHWIQELRDGSMSHLQKNHLHYNFLHSNFQKSFQKTHKKKTEKIGRAHV